MNGPYPWTQQGFAKEMKEEKKMPVFNYPINKHAKPEMINRPLTPDEIAFARQMAADGESYSEIGRALNCSGTTVKRRLSEEPTKEYRPYTRKYSRVPESVIQKMKDLYAQGQNYTEIARQTGVNGTTVANHLGNHIRQPKKGYTPVHLVIRDQVIQLRHEGFSVEDIRKKLNTSESTVRKAMHASPFDAVSVKAKTNGTNGQVPVSRYGNRFELAQLKDDIIKWYYEDKLAKPTIAQRVGCSTTTVQYWLMKWKRDEREGITIPPPTKEEAESLLKTIFKERVEEEQVTEEKPPVVEVPPPSVQPRKHSRKNIDLEDKRDEVYALLAAGWTSTAIADRMGVSLQTILRRVRRWDEETKAKLQAKPKTTRTPRVVNVVVDYEKLAMANVVSLIEQEATAQKRQASIALRRLNIGGYLHLLASANTLLAFSDKLRKGKTV